MLTIGPFNPLLRPGLRKDFRDEFAQFEQQYSQFLRTGTTTLPEQRAVIMTGLRRLLERGDGESVQYDDPKMSGVVSAVDKEFAAGFAITRKTMEDDQYHKAQQASKWLANAAKMTIEYRAAGFLDDAFTGNTYKGIDGQALCTTGHTLLNSSTTVSNRLATDVGLSVTGVTSMFDLAQLTKDENGDPRKIFPDTLVIGNSAGDYHRALQIFGSEKEPFTAENQDNAVKKRLPTPKIVISAYKQSLKSYFMIDSKYNDAWFLTRRALEFDDTHDFDTDAAKFKATIRFLIWFVDWRGWIGSNPT